MPTEFFVQLVCPSCFRSKWLRVCIPHITREALLNGYWKFECPIHGRIREKPLQVHEKLAVILLAESASRWLQ
jgi:hypothetical protein